VAIQLSNGTVHIDSNRETKALEKHAYSNTLVTLLIKMRKHRVYLERSTVGQVLEELKT
jgi:hypothetical protein